MPTKLNRVGEQQEYNASNGEYSNSSNGSINKEIDVKELRKKAFKMGLNIDYIGRTDTVGGGVQHSNWVRREKQLDSLKENGFTDEEINVMVKDAREKQAKKNENFKNFLKSSKEKYLKKQFGDDVSVDENGKDIKFKHYVDDDNVNIITNNVQYWKNKDTYVLWVDTDKVVYLKSWDVTPVRNMKYGDAYSVKLNRQYYKPYNTYKSDTYIFEKGTTFDDLVNIAKEQDNENIEWRI